MISAFSYDKKAEQFRKLIFSRGEKSMKKMKAAKMVANGVILAVLVVLGAAAFQLGTSLKEDDAQKELTLESEEQDQSADASTDEELLQDAGTSQVEAKMSEEDSFPDIEDSNLLEMETEDDFEGEEEDADSLTSGENEEEVTDTSAGAVASSALNFSEDTLTEWPVNGNILLDYSMDQTTYFPTLDQYRLSPAIAVQAVEGAPVVAAADGVVFSIEDTAQTGTTVTMELGNGYQAIYGQLTNLSFAEGDSVKKGDIIGYIHTPTKYYSTEGSNLYFAMKKDGEPIDPILYLP